MVYIMKEYIKYEDVLEKVGRHVRRCRKQGEALLGGERQLAQDFNASRVTIRKVLTELENSGLIAREKIGTRILPEQRQKFRYGYVATMHHDSGSFWYDFYFRVWQKLSHLAVEAGFEIEFFGYDPEDPEEPLEKFLARLDGVDVVFPDIARKELYDALRKRKGGVVYLNAAMWEDNAPLISLDDAAVGRLAARLLLDAECRRAAAVSVFCYPGNIPFKRRAEYFRAAMAAAGAEAEVHAEYEGSRMAQVDALHRYVNGLPERGFDGIFFMSDEYCDLIASGLFQAGMVPGKVSLVAFDGSSTARAHHPPFTTIGHGSRQMAEEILRMVNRYETLPAKDRLQPEIRMITPDVYPGRTLRKQP